MSYLFIKKQNEIRSVIDTLKDDSDHELELELRLGSISKQGFFETNLGRAQWNKIKNIEGIYGSTLSPNEESLVLRYANPEGFRKIIEISNNKKKIQMVKRNKMNLGIGSHFRLSLSHEKLLDDSSKNPSNLITIIRKDRQSRKSLDGLWRYDFTIMCITDLLDYNISKNFNIKDWYDTVSGKNIESTIEYKVEKKYQIEIEYVGSLELTLDEISDSLETQYQYMIEYFDMTSQKFESPLLKNMIDLFNPTYSYNKRFILNKKFKLSFSKLANQVNQFQLTDLHVVKKNYCVTEKADGERILLYIDSEGHIYSLNRSLYLTYTEKKITDAQWTNSILDCEWIEPLKKILIFDILIKHGKDLTELDFKERYSIMLDFPLDAIQKGYSKLKSENTYFKDILFKKHYFVEDSNSKSKSKPKSIFKLSKKILNQEMDYEIDGLIFTPIDLPYYNKKTLKWKANNTIDFLIRVLKVRSEKSKKEDKSYKIVTLGLYVMINLQLYETKLKKGIDFTRKKDYFQMFPYVKQNTTRFPIEFITQNGDFSNCTLKINDKNIKTITLNGIGEKEVFITKRGVQFFDGSIIECEYQQDKIKCPWVPYKFRLDKTKEFYKLAKNNDIVAGPNDYYVAETILKLEQQPITEDMIMGIEKPPDVYFTTQHKRSEYLGDMIKFHNWIKKNLYETYSYEKENILELAFGRGGDLWKLAESNATHVVCIEHDQFAIEEAKKRLVQLKQQYKTKNKNTNKKSLPKFSFYQGDLNKDSISTILKSSKIKMFDVVNCHFALHYFSSSSKDQLKFFFKSLNKHIMPKGLFIITMFDGKSIVKLFNKKKKEMNEEIVWTVNNKYNTTTDEIEVIRLKKLYQNKKLESFGQKISLYFHELSENQNEEFLINFTILKDFFEKHHYSLIESKMFNEYYPEWTHQTTKEMPKWQQEYSFLYRSAVFQKES